MGKFSSQIPTAPATKRKHPWREHGVKKNAYISMKCDECFVIRIDGIGWSLDGEGYFDTPVPRCGEAREVANQLRREGKGPVYL